MKVKMSKRNCGSKEFEALSYETYEIGRFMIGDLNKTDSVLYRKGFIFRNLAYFRRKVREISIGEEVEVVGILKVDSSKFNIGIPDYFIDVMDIKPIKEKETDVQICEIIKDKICHDYFYFEKLIDSIHPLTYGINLYFPIKFLYSLAYLTGGSWNNNSNIRFYFRY